MIKSTEEELKKVIGIPGVAATVINFSIGVGVYVLPALIAIQLGPAAIVGYVLCGLMFAAIMLCYVEIASRVKVAGGSYAYVETAFGPLAGFIVNWLFFFGWGIISDAAVMNVVADSLSVIYPVVTKALPRALLFFVLLSSMAIMNVISAKISVKLVEFVTIIKLLPLLLIILFGISHIHYENLQWNEFPSLKSLGETALILFFVFAGFETSLNISGEIKNPGYTIPRGILTGGIIVFLIYIFIQSVTVGVLGNELALFKDAPLAEIAKRIIGIKGGIIILIAAMVSGLGGVSGDVLSSSRLLYAGAKNGLFPKFLGRVHPRFSTPYWSVIIFTTLIFIFCVSGGFKQLAVLASGALLLIYLAVILSMIKLRVTNYSEEKYFKVPGGLTIPLMAIIAILWVLSNLAVNEIISIATFVVIVTLVYLIAFRKKFNLKVEPVDNTL